MAVITFKRTANGFDVTDTEGTTTVVMSDMPLTFLNIGLAAQGYTQTQVLQLALGEEITVNV
jgi:hypothetical protein